MFPVWTSQYNDIIATYEYKHNDIKIKIILSLGFFVDLHIAT